MADTPNDMVASTSPTPSRSGDRFGHYRLVRQIAVGGYGIVFEAKHVQLGFPVAIKIISTNASAAELREFRREAGRLSKFIGQRGIIEVRDYGVRRESDGGRRPYLVMNLLQGRGVGLEAGQPIRAKSITSYSQAHNLDEREKLKLFVRVCDAVHVAHEQSFVHRDLKPANIIVNEPSGGPAYPVLIDFGISLKADIGGQGRVTGIAGTVPYMSPEQTREVSNLDARSDIYTLGVILYELMCGQMPYSVVGAPRPVAFEVIQLTPPDFATPTASRLPGHVKQIIRRAMEKAPSRRYESAAALSGDIRAVLDGDAPKDAKRTTTGRTLAMMRRNLVGRSWCFLALAAVVATGLTDSVGKRLIYDWTAANELIERAFIDESICPPMTDVVMVLRADATSTALGYGPLPPDQRWKLRPALGDCIARVAEAGARVIVVDIGMQAARPGDSELIAAISNVRQTGPDAIPIVCLVTHFAGEPDPESKGVPHKSNGLSPAIDAVASRRGRGTAESSRVPTAPDFARIHLVEFTRALSALPSLVLEAFAAFTHPGLIPEYSIDGQSSNLTIQYSSPGSFGRNVLDTQVIRPSQIVFTSDPFLWTVTHRLPPLNESLVQRAVVSMEDVIAKNEESLRALKGKVVVIGGGHTDDDVHYDYSGAHSGTSLVAVAIQMLIGGTVIKMPAAIEEVGLTFASVMGGLWLVLAWTRRRRWWPRWASFGVWIAWLSSVIGVLLLSLLLARLFLYFLNPLMLIIGLTTSATFTIVVEYGRRKALMYREQKT